MRAWPDDPAGVVDEADALGRGVELRQALVGVAQGVDDGPREQPVQQQELGRVLVPERRPAGAQEGLVGAGAAEHVHPGHAGGEDIPGGEHARGHVRPLQGPAQDQEQPALVVADGGVGQAADHGGALQDPVAEPVGAHHVLAVLVEPVVGRVEAFPEPGGDGLAGAAGVFPGGTEGTGNGGGALLVVGEGVEQFGQAEILTLRARTHDGEEFLRHAALFLHGQMVEPFEVDVQDAGGAVGPFHVAADPKQ